MVQALVVDDDESTRDVLRFLLEEEGYATIEAADGAAALDALQASTLPLITLLDFDLPGIDGLAVLTAVGNDAALARRHRFILLTAVARTRIQLCDEICARLGVPILLKPFNVDELLGAIAMAASDLAAHPASAPMVQH